MEKWKSLKLSSIVLILSLLTLPLSGAELTAKADKTTTRQYERVTFSIALDKQYDNPFNADQIAVDAIVTHDNGSSYSVPCFYYQPYQWEKADRLRTSPAGPAQWQGRLSFSSPGKYKVAIQAKDASGLNLKHSAITITVEKAKDAAGMIRRSKTDHRYFVTDRGETWFPVGANVCWPEQRGWNGNYVFSYNHWFSKYAENGCNYARIWLSLSWNALGLQTPRSGYDKIDLHRAALVDDVLELAEQNGLRLMFCFNAHGMLRSKNHQHGSWEDNVFHPDHGAPFKKPMEFFTNEKMLHAYKNYLRYMVARYGYSSSVFCWEFFNEVDLVDDYNPKVVAQWHSDMAKVLRKIDPWDHLITTSFARSDGTPLIDKLPEIDFTQTHRYGPRDIAKDLNWDLQKKEAAKVKPHFHGEYGIHGSGRETSRLDPDGWHIHNGLFSSPGQLQAGTPMTWWWDSYVHPQNLYHIYGSFSKWIDGFDFVKQNPTKLNPEFHWNDSAKTGTPHLRAYGIIGKTQGLIWIQNPNYLWATAAKKDFKPTPTTDAQMFLSKIPAGNWEIQWYDTHKGQTISSSQYTVKNDGKLTINLPAINVDIAIRMIQN